MIFLSVATKPGPLLELHSASSKITCVWVVLGVHVHVFYKILLLGEGSVANLTYEFLQSTMNCNEMSLETEPR